MEHNRVVYSKAYDSEVEYLELTGTQWLDTGYYGDINTAMECMVYITDTSKQYVIAGNRSSATANNISFLIGKASNIVNYGFLLDFGNHSTNRLVVDYQYTNGYVKLYTSKNIRKLVDITSGNEYIKQTIVTSNQSTPATIKIAKRDNNYPSTLQNLKGRIKSFKLWSSDTLLLDLIPVRKGSTGYLYDKVSGKLFANKGTGNFILGNDVSNPVPNIRRVFRFDNKRFVMPMPYDSKIEYLESTGTQYIDTEVIIDSETAFAGTTVDFQAVNINYGTCVIAGSVLSEGANKYKNLNLLVYNNKFYTDGAGWRFNNNVNDITLRTIATATGTAKGISRKQFLLFARYVVGLGEAIGAGCRIFSCKMYKNEILIRDFIPVRRGNVGYLYDKVSGRLFGNSGTGQFILGNDIND